MYVKQEIKILIIYLATLNIIYYLSNEFDMADILHYGC